MGFSHYEDASELLEERARSALWSGFRDRSNPGGWMNRGIDGAFKNGTRSVIDCILYIVEKIYLVV